MAKREVAGALPRPTPEPPITNPSAGKIKVFVTGRLNLTSNDQRVVIERGD